MPEPPRPSAEEISKNLQPYVAQLGLLVFAWNKLQDNLAALFWFITGIPNGIIPFAIWNTIESDRTQRKMLEAATKAAVSALNAKEELKNTRVKDDILWLIHQTDSLADQRNDAIHSPYWFVIGPGPMTMVPNDFQSHPRAKKLKMKLEHKTLLEEFKWCNESADALATFAKRLTMSLRNQEIAWPDRPKLPNRGQKKSPQDQPRRPPAK
jgi:hypothetical protein